MLYAINGALFGGVARCYKGLFSYRDNWDGKFALTYYIGLPLTIVLGVVFYCIFTESFITLTIGKEKLFSSTYSSLAVGFIVGFSWESGLDKVAKVFS